MLDFLIENYYASYALVIITALFAWIMQINVKGTFNKYNKISTKRGVPAHVIARQILDSNGLYNIDVIRVSGNLTDHYDPKNNVISLSDSVYNSATVGAIGVTAHECGHAVQHAEGYIPIKIRNAAFPVVNFVSHSWIWFFLIGLIAGVPVFTELGIIFFACVVLFQLVTLPVEFNASKRALKTIGEQNILDDDERVGARKTLSAAALTYIASLFMSLAQLIRLLSQSNRRR